MDRIILPYESPRLALIGDFAELTRITGPGSYVDYPFFGGWWNP